MFIALTADFHETGFLNYANAQNRNKLLSDSSLPSENDKDGNNQHESKSGADNLLENLKQDDSSKLNANDYSLQDFNAISQIGQIQYENKKNNSDQHGNNPKNLKLINTNTMDRYSYVKSCPTRYTDPTGHNDCDYGKLATGIFVSIAGAGVTVLGAVIFIAGAGESATIVGIVHGGAAMAVGGIMASIGIVGIVGGGYIAYKSGCLPNSSSSQQTPTNGDEQ